MNENMGYVVPPEQNHKKGKGMVVLVVVLIVIILALVGYLVYDKVFADSIKKDEKDTVLTEKKKEKEEKEEVKTEELDVNSTEVQSLYTNLTTGHSQYGGIWDYFKDQTVRSQDIPDFIVSSIALSRLSESGVINLSAQNRFSASEIDRVVDQIFGKNYRYIHSTIQGCPVFFYDASTNMYTSDIPQCGGTSGPGNEAKVVKALKKGDKLEIYTRVVFMTPSSIGSDYTYYKDYNHTQVVEVSRDSMNAMLRENTNYEKGTLYKMVFTLEDGNYVFVSSEPTTM